MTAPFEHASDVREALWTIAADPALGPESFGNARTAANLLRDLLPDAPRETNLLLAAITAGTPAILTEHISQGMAGDTAISLAAATLASQTAFTPEACQWVVTELAVALTLVPDSGIPARPIASHPATEIRAESVAAPFRTTLSGPPPPKGARRRPGSGRRKVAALTTAGIAMAAAAGAIVYAALPGTTAQAHHHNAPTAHQAAHPRFRSPAGVVESYIAAINSRDWTRAWVLGGKNLGETYHQLVAGYAHTSHVRITSITASGSSVTVLATATETSGVRQRYRLSYLVSHGTITAGQSTLVNG